MIKLRKKSNTSEYKMIKKVVALTACIKFHHPKQESRRNQVTSILSQMIET